MLCDFEAAGAGEGEGEGSSSPSPSSPMSGTVGRESCVMGAVEVSGVFCGVGAVNDEFVAGMFMFELIV